METKNNVKERKVTITRIFNAPRKMVFKAWTDPKQMEQWWGHMDLPALIVKWM